MVLAPAKLGLPLGLRGTVTVTTGPGCRGTVRFRHWQQVPNQPRRSRRGVRAGAARRQWAPAYRDLQVFVILFAYYI